MRPFLDESIRYLRDVYLPRLETAVAELGEADLWWRPHERATSAGNLLLHLAGNVRQWIVSGLGGAADHRERGAEFAAREGADRDALLAALGATVHEACAVLDGLAEDALDRPCRIQGFATTVRGAIYHVVEHFSWHTGQIVWIAKLRAGGDHGIAFYDDAGLNRVRNQ